MSDIKGYTFRLKLNRPELDLLYKMSMDQYKRWDKIIEAEENSPIAEDYQYDSLHLRDMLDDLDRVISDNSNSKEISFSGFQTRIIIESMDYELNLWKNGVSNLKSEEFHILDLMRTRFRQKAIEEFGENVLKPIHE